MAEIDLHTHSTASDGTLSPSALVQHAEAIGLKAIALTDHDTVAGLDEAALAATRVEFIRGCELSVHFPQGSMHILGLWLPRRMQQLPALLHDLARKRAQRNERILENLRRHGVAIDDAELQACAAGGVVGRPHVARLLVEKGHAASIHEAFHLWLRPGTPGYAPKAKLLPHQAISALKAEGATVILAHPSTLNLDPEPLETLLGELKAAGLDGVEVYYPLHTPAQTRLFAELCRRLDLLESAGSDFHGDNKPSIALGRGKDGLHGPYALVERMKAVRARMGLPVEA
ncbi:MAG: PHP domain-containing protein [Desulfomicrobiaceae bacterium]|nr:PHP domain-containing protein [Desulfomicrobiaceae bacterium]